MQYYTIKISKDRLKTIGFCTVLFFPLTHMVLWAASPWWCLVWLLLLAF